MFKVVLVTNIPVPYREKTHEILNKELNSNYTVIFCSDIEPNRKWKFKLGNYNKLFLSKKKNTFIHNNLSIWKHLTLLNPHVVITTGFYPTMLYAFLWSLINRKKHICFIDGTINSERELSFIHSIVRKLVFFKTDAVIGPSNGSLELFRRYNIISTQMFKSPLCIENDKFNIVNPQPKSFDIMFSGQLIERKLPFFFIEIANNIKKQRGACNVLILGDGVQKEEMLNKLKKYNIDFEYAGFVEQDKLPGYYALTKLFLFPTQNDPWGIVVNEAMASGIPVITCENAGVAHDLVNHEKNGYVLPLDVEIWTNHIINLLDNKILYQNMSQNAYLSVKEYNHQQSAIGILNAVKYTIT